MFNVLQNYQNSVLQDAFTTMSYNISFEPSRYQEFLSCLIIQQQEKEYYEKKIEEIKVEQYQQQQQQQQKQYRINNNSMNNGNFLMSHMYPISPSQMDQNQIEQLQQNQQENLQQQASSSYLQQQQGYNINLAHNNSIQGASIIKTEGVIATEGEEESYRSLKAITDINEIEEDADYDLKYVEYIEKQNVELKNRIDYNQQLMEKMETNQNTQLQELEEKIQKIQSYLSEFNLVHQTQMYQMEQQNTQ